MVRTTTNLILIRHGETLWNAGGRFQGHSDIALSPIGEHQAECLAAHFPAKAVDAVYSSDLKRAVKTAACIAKRFQLTVKQVPALKEISFGEWEGLTYEEITSRWSEQIAMFYTRPERMHIPGGESFSEVQSRAVGAILEICQQHEDQTVAVVAHGGVTRTILAEALHIPLRYIWSLKQENTAVNIIRYDGKHRLVELVNSTCHLG